MTAPRNPAPTTSASGVMTKFRIGDHVRITHSPCRYFDQVGTVEDINEDQDHPFAVDGLEPWPLWFGADEMVLAEWPTTGGGVSESAKFQAWQSVDCAWCDNKATGNAFYIYDGQWFASCGKHGRKFEPFETAA